MIMTDPELELTAQDEALPLVIVEDDPAFARTLRRSFERRGYAVEHAASPEELEALLESHDFQFAVVDLKLGTGSGLTCVQMLAERDPETRIVVLTGFASIATAVEAIKLGAAHYLAKPANTDDIEEAFGRVGGDPTVPLDTRKTSIKTVEWEYIHSTLVECDFNISEAARRLGMHRRTLARKLEKRPLR
jgi:two-component system response regulator RegA